MNYSPQRKLLHREPRGVEVVTDRRRLKLKRPQTAKMYRQQLDELYAEVAAEEEGSTMVKAKL